MSLVDPRGGPYPAPGTVAVGEAPAPVGFIFPFNRLMDSWLVVRICFAQRTGRVSQRGREARGRGEKESRREGEVRESERAVVTAVCAYV